MADKDKPYSLNDELNDATLRLQEYEAQVLTGEADEIGNETLIEKRLIEQERAKKLLKYRADVQQTVARADGRRVLWRILEIAGPNRISHTPGDPYETAFKDGKRAVANELLLMLFDADPAVYSQMQREHASDVKSEQAARNKQREEINK